MFQYPHCASLPYVSSNYLKTYLKIIFGILLTYLKVNSQTVKDFTSFENFDKLTTLKIISYIHDTLDCGEFGGHREYIIFTKSNNQLYMNYEREKSDCLLSFKNEKKYSSLIVFSYKDSVTIDKEKDIISYIERLINHRPNKNSSSNAPNYYEVILTKDSFSLSFKISDKDNSWDEYESFRNRLITK